VVLIANPAAGRGRGGRLLPAVRALLATSGVTDVRLTDGPGDERRLAREAAAEGVATIIALGGDGTWGQAARGILESRRDTRLALLVAGTGNDFAYALGLPVHDVRRMVDIALGTNEQRVDVGVVDGLAFLNVAGFGFETSVLEAAPRLPLLRGHLRYVATALPQLFTYRAIEAQIRFEDGREATGKFLALIMANGPRFGGGFRVAPGASVRDGQLDFLTVRDGNVIRRAALFARVRFGTHAAEPEVALRRVREVRIQFQDPPLMDVDGELVRAGAAELDITCMPRALRVACGVRIE
jgi:diacylglycerol kinase (ATP)